MALDPGTESATLREMLARIWEKVRRWICFQSSRLAPDGTGCLQNLAGSPNVKRSKPQNQITSMNIKITNKTSPARRAAKNARERERLKDPFVRAAKNARERERRKDPKVRAAYNENKRASREARNFLNHLRNTSRVVESMAEITTTNSGNEVQARAVIEPTDRPLSRPSK